MSSSLEQAPITVHLPPTLAPAQTEKHASVRVTGTTVREVIAALEDAYPGLRFRLCLETGDLRPFVNVFVNGIHLRYLRGMETPVPPGATVHILQSVAGG
jgi:molybdopterin synthase sulfur carrier subunit